MMERQASSDYRVRVLDIEATNRCNAQCLICPRDELERPVGDMSRETWSTLLSRIQSARLERIIFSGFGEPLLHPLLSAYLRELRGAFTGIIQVNTNGFKLTPEVARDLIEAEVDMLNVSYNGIEKEEYERIMRGMKYERLASNIREFRKARGKRKRPVLSLQSSMPGIKEEKKRIMGVASTLGVEMVQLYGFNNRAGYVEDEGRSGSDTPLGQRFCYPLLFIAWDGTIYPCSHDIKGTQPLGKIGEVSLGEVEKTDYPMCARCTVCEEDEMKRHKIWKNLWRHRLQSLGW